MPTVSCYGKLHCKIHITPSLIWSWSTTKFIRLEEQVGTRQVLFIHWAPTMVLFIGNLFKAIPSSTFSTLKQTAKLFISVVPLRGKMDMAWGLPGIHMHSNMTSMGIWFGMETPSMTAIFLKKFHLRFLIINWFLRAKPRRREVLLRVTSLSVVTLKLARFCGQNDLEIGVQDLSISFLTRDLHIRPASKVIRPLFMRLRRTAHWPDKCRSVCLTQRRADTVLWSPTMNFIWLALPMGTQASPKPREERIFLLLK